MTWLLEWIVGAAAEWRVAYRENWELNQVSRRAWLAALTVVIVALTVVIVALTVVIFAVWFLAWVIA